MHSGNIEPRRAMWARAEVLWDSTTGKAERVPATIEDKSTSGARIRLKTDIPTGSSLTVKSARDQFFGIVRNQRRDGDDFVLGIERDTARNKKTPEPPSKPAATESVPVPATELKSLPQTESAPAPTTSPSTSAPTTRQKSTTALLPSSPEPPASAAPPKTVVPATQPAATPVPAPLPQPVAPKAVAVAPAPTLPQRTAIDSPGKSRDSSRSGTVERRHSSAPAIKPGNERHAMPSKGFFSLFRGHSTSEESADKPETNVSAAPAETRGQLFSCEDIYLASGILSGLDHYDITKVAHMLTNRHIRDLPREAKRASLLMALDAAGTHIEAILQDATRRQHALDTYEAAQQKQFEEFEASKTRENSQIQAELNRLTAHYSERIQRNLEQISREKETLHNWQLMKEQETKRIADAVAVCVKQPVSETDSSTRPSASRAAAASSVQNWP